jgi:hypothetical protein
LLEHKKGFQTAAPEGEEKVDVNEELEGAQQPPQPQVPPQQGQQPPMPQVQPKASSLNKKADDDSYHFNYYKDEDETADQFGQFLHEGDRVKDDMGRRGQIYRIVGDAVYVIWGGPFEGSENENRSPVLMDAKQLTKWSNLKSTVASFSDGIKGVKVIRYSNYNPNFSTSVWQLLNRERTNTHAISQYSSNTSYINENGMEIPVSLRKGIKVGEMFERPDNHELVRFAGWIEKTAVKDNGEPEDDYNDIHDTIDSYKGIDDDLSNELVEDYKNKGNEEASIDIHVEAEPSVIEEILDTIMEEGDSEEFEKSEDDKLEGGVGDDKEDDEFDSDQLKKGEEVEKEHTDDDEIAKEIAKDHLTEMDDYYDKLEDMEKKGGDSIHSYEDSKDLEIIERTKNNIVVSIEGDYWEKCFNKEGIDQMLLEGQWDSPEEFEKNVGESPYSLINKWFTIVHNRLYFPNKEDKLLLNKVSKIVVEKGKWKVKNEAGTKTLGTHDTKAEAEKQLQAIEINKHKESNLKKKSSSWDNLLLERELPNGWIVTLLEYKDSNYEEPDGFWYSVMVKPNKNSDDVTHVWSSPEGNAYNYERYLNIAENVFNKAVQRYSKKKSVPDFTEQDSILNKYEQEGILPLSSLHKKSDHYMSPNFGLWVASLGNSLQGEKRDQYHNILAQFLPEFGHDDYSEIVRNTDQLQVEQKKQLESYLYDLIGRKEFANLKKKSIQNYVTYKNDGTRFIEIWAGEGHVDILVGKIDPLEGGETIKVFSLETDQVDGHSEDDDIIIWVRKHMQKELKYAREIYDSLQKTSGDIFLSKKESFKKLSFDDPYDTQDDFYNDRGSYDQFLTPPDKELTIGDKVRVTEESTDMFGEEGVVTDKLEFNSYRVNINGEDYRFYKDELTKIGSKTAADISDQVPPMSNVTDESRTDSPAPNQQPLPPRQELNNMPGDVLYDSNQKDQGAGKFQVTTDPVEKTVTVKFLEQDKEQALNNLMGNPQPQPNPLMQPAQNPPALVPGQERFQPQKDFQDTNSGVQF